MKRNTRWGFFPFDAADYKAAQAYLDKKAASGWVLDRLVCKYFARFVPARGRYHNVDLNLYRPRDGEEHDAYVQLCQDAGWETVYDARGILLFRSQPGRQPVPLQTDADMEAERFWKKYMCKQVLFLTGVLLVLLALEWLSIFRAPGAVTGGILCYNSRLLAAAVLVGLLVYVLWYYGSILVSYFHYRRAGRLRGRFGAWPMGVALFVMCCLWVVAVCLNMAEGFGLGKTVDLAWSPYSEEYTATVERCRAYPVLTAADFGVEPSQSGRYLDGRSSLLVNQLEYYESMNDGAEGFQSFYTDRYQCASVALARIMVSARREETSRGEDIYFWGPLDWQEAPGLGFDESWSYQDGRYLLLRQGKTVAIVHAGWFDLTQPDYLDLIRQRLQLEG